LQFYDLSVTINHKKIEACPGGEFRDVASVCAIARRHPRRCEATRLLQRLSKGVQGRWQGLMGLFWRLAIRASQNDVSFMQNASKRPYVTAKNNHSIRPTAS
jgi:hypothetical protein